MLNILQVILHTGHVSPVARCVTLTVGRSAASSQPPFGPTLTRAAPTPLPGISGSLYRYGSAHRILVLMLRCAESAHLFFSFRINVSSNMFFFHIVHTYCDIFAKGEEKKNQFFCIILHLSPDKSCCDYRQLRSIFASSKNY